MTGMGEVIVWEKVIVDSIGIFVGEIVGLLVGIIDPVVGLPVGIINPVVDWKEVVSPAVEAAGVLAVANVVPPFCWLVSGLFSGGV